MSKPKDDNFSRALSLDHLSIHELSRVIRTRLANLHNLDQFVLELVTLGDKAVIPIGEYLDGKPEVIPQSRVAAVNALAGIGTTSALDQLKITLFQYELKDLPPMLSQSEYVVKNTIIEEFLKKNAHQPTCDFLDAFLRYRLPAAMQAIVKYHISDGISALIDALEDDVLATRAAEALEQLGKEASPQLLQMLTIEHILDPFTRSRINRQKLILSAKILGDIGEKMAKPILLQMSNDADPNIAASSAAALTTLDFSSISPQRTTILLKGTLSPEWLVRDICRNAALLISDIGSNAALDLIDLKSLPDLYGDYHEISENDKVWLITYIIENGQEENLIKRLIKTCPLDLLKRGLWHVEAEKAISNLLLLARSPDRSIRKVIAHILRRMDNKTALPALIIFLGEWDQETVREAMKALLKFPKELVKQAVQKELPFIRPLWKRWLIRLRLRHMI